MVNNEHLPAHPAARAAQSLLHPFHWCPALGRHTGVGHTQRESWDRWFQDKPCHSSAGTTSLPIRCGSNWAQESWSGALGTGTPERGIHKLFPKALFRQCSISNGKLRMDREMTRTVPCPKVPQGTYSKPLLRSYHRWLSRVVLALLPSGCEPLLGHTFLGVISPTLLQW